MLENCLETTLYTSGSIRINVQLNQIKIRADFPLNFIVLLHYFAWLKTEMPSQKHTAVRAVLHTCPFLATPLFFKN